VCFTYGYLRIDVAALETIMSANKKISTKSLDMVVGATPNHHIGGVANATTIFDPLWWVMTTLKELMG
jgi:hypothetical protein